MRRTFPLTPHRQVVRNSATLAAPRTLGASDGEAPQDASRRERNEGAETIDGSGYRRQSGHPTSVKFVYGTDTFQAGID